MDEIAHSTVVILGAGPGGVMAALRLSQLNIPCVILERDTFPRDKICGDALSGKVVEVMKRIDPSLVNRFSMEPTQVGSWGVTFVAPNERALRVPFRKEFDKSTEQAPGYISRRIDFDHWWLKEALKSPLVQLKEGFEARSFTKTDSGFLIQDKSGTQAITASLVIASDGANSAFARKIGGMKVEGSHHCAGIRAYYQGVEGMDPDNFIELQFLKDFLPGYFWIFPLPNGMTNVGVGMRSDKVSQHKINLKKDLLNLIATHPTIAPRFENATLVGEIKGFGLPLGSKKRPLSGPHFMLTGDAASLIDPFSGEGIGNAMYSGLFAAEQAAHCIQENDFSASMLSAYDQKVYNRLWSELKLGRTMQQLVRFPWLFNFIVNKANRNSALSELISSMFEDIDLRSRLGDPRFYFRLLLGRK